MKTHNFIICILLIFFSNSFIVKLQGQCLPGFEPTTLSHEITVTGFGNDFYNFDFPQFNPIIGTLTAVSIQTSVTLNFGFYFENLNITAINRNMRVTRSDDFSSTALGTQSPIVNTPPTYNSGIKSLAANNGVPNSGPDYYQMPVTSILNNYTQTTTVADISSFMGTGNVSFDYNSSTSNAITNGSSSNISTSNSTEDIITFRVIYTYCAPVIVPSTVKNFTVQKLSADNLKLSWFIPNDIYGKEYIVEKSSDGKNFEEAGTIFYNPSLRGNYSFFYSLQPTDKGYLQFRIKEINPEGSYYYSALRSILLDDKSTTVKIYPTLVTDYVQVSMPGQSSKDVSVKLVNASGNVLQQQRANTNTLTMNFEKRLPRGMYFVQVTDMRTRQQTTSKIFVQ